MYMYVASIKLNSFNQMKLECSTVGKFDTTFSRQFILIHVHVAMFEKLPKLKLKMRHSFSLSCKSSKLLSHVTK